MEAILEMFVAIFVGILEMAILGVQVIATALALLVELLFTAIFHGRTAAAEKYRIRQAAAVTRKSAAADPMAEGDLATSLASPETSESARPTPRLPVKVQLVIGIMIVLIAFGAIGVNWYQRELTKQRVAQTWKQLDLLADGFSAQVKLPRPQLPEGKLADLDAWKTPCELFVDEWLLGTLIVVRSWGPDARHGTLDDLLAIRITRPPIKVFGKKLLAVGIDLIRDRVQKLLPGKGVPPQNMDIRIDE